MAADTVRQDKVWIETNIMGERTIMLDCGLPNLTPIRYCTFHYSPPFTDNSGTLSAAESLARTLGAGSTVNNVNVGIDSNQFDHDLYKENESLKAILRDVLDKFGDVIADENPDLSERIHISSAT